MELWTLKHGRQAWTAKRNQVCRSHIVSDTVHIPNFLNHFLLAFQTAELSWEVAVMASHPESLQEHLFLICRPSLLTVRRSTKKGAHHTPELLHLSLQNNNKDIGRRDTMLPASEASVACLQNVQEINDAKKKSLTLANIELFMRSKIVPNSSITKRHYRTASFHVKPCSLHQNGGDR